MPKEKKITCFSRNGVRITKTLYVDMTKDSNKRANGCIKVSMTSRVIEKGNPGVKKEAYDEFIRKISDLGFWYNKVIHHGSQIVGQEPDKSSLILEISLLHYGTKWDMEYPKTYNGVNLGIDARPWDLLPGYQGMPSHFVNDLYRETIKFLDTIENLGESFSSVKYTKWSDVRQDVLRDFFGPSGKPEIQPNDIKILSHGFDLKESFRKRKEQ
jgi:hypothetical protein